LQELTDYAQSVAVKCLGWQCRWILIVVYLALSARGSFFFLKNWLVEAVGTVPKTEKLLHRGPKYLQKRGSSLSMGNPLQ